MWPLLCYLDSVLEYMTELLVVMSGEPILSRKLFIMIIMFRMSLILPKLIVQHNSGPLLHSKETWRYLGFYFNKKLFLCYHTWFYANKALSIVKALNLLGNSLRGLLPLQKRLLYHICVLPIALYGFQLWFFKGTLTYYPLQNLNRMQCRAALWITGAFQISLTYGIKAIAGLMPISIYLKKLLGRMQLKVNSLPKQHALRALLDRHHSKGANPHATSTTCLTTKQNIKLKSPIQDINHRLNQIHPAFNSMNQELRPGLHIVDLFANQLSFHTVKCSDSVTRANHTQKLNNILLSSISQPNTIIVITNASVRKGHYTILIAHGWQSRRLVFNSEHTAVNVTPAKVETFALSVMIE